VRASPQAGDLVSQTYCLGQLACMDWLAGRIPEGWAHLRESTQIATRVGHPLAIQNCEDLGAHLCATTQRWAEAVTLWAAFDTHTKDGGFIDTPQDVDKSRCVPPSHQPRRFRALPRRLLLGESLCPSSRPEQPNSGATGAIVSAAACHPHTERGCRSGPEEPPVAPLRAACRFGHATR
jgi:hypothetical protein